MVTSNCLDLQQWTFTGSNPVHELSKDCLSIKAPIQFSQLFLCPVVKRELLRLIIERSLVRVQAGHVSGS